jgi:hypothetical protein
MRRVSPTAELPAPVDTTPPARRARVRAFIVVAVLAQLLVPLTYYLRDDPYDERFAWRMFSGVRLQECELGVFETRGGSELAVNPYQVVPAGWVEGLKRNRRRVVERYLTLRCEREGMSRVRVTNRCTEVDGTPLPPIEVTRDCGREGDAP